MRNRYVLLADILMLAGAMVGAFVLRFDFLELHQYRKLVLPCVIAAVLLKPPIMFLFGLYSRYWLYLSVGDLLAISWATITAAVVMSLFALAGVFWNYLEWFPRSIIVIDALLSLMGICGVRLAIRLSGERRQQQRRGSGPLRRVLVVGAGDAGAMVVREMIRNPQMGLRPVAFADDYPAKQGKRIHHVPVAGPTSDVEALVRRLKADEVVIAMPTAPGEAVRAIAETCQRAGVPSRTIPGVYELLDGKVSVSRLRKVRIEDVLRRTQLSPVRATAPHLAGQCVLVTGAGGSIGRELCRQIGFAGPSTLVLLGHGENSLYEAEAELRQAFPTLSLAIVVADVRDELRMAQALSRFRPSVVFHAAAHKHVPLMEDNPEEAFTNNVLGTQVVVQAALRFGVERMVLISTDKAVSPTSIMGATKRLAEAVVCEAAQKTGKMFVVVRFGNVLGSRGSVIPLFERQIERGGPLTITHPDMKRFFMTIPEAVHLVLMAAGLGGSGKLFVLNMGEAVRILDLAKDVILLSGVNPESIAITYTGLRPGEKLEELLWESGAVVSPTAHAEILQVEEPVTVNHSGVQASIANLKQAAQTGNRAAIEAALMDAVGAFAPTSPLDHVDFQRPARGHEARAPHL